MIFLRALLAFCLIAALLTPAKAGLAEESRVHPEIWPALTAPLPPDPALEAFLDGLLARMTLEEKVGQLIQADISSIRPEDLLTYPLGSVLAGGNSGPGGDELAPPQAWLALADAFHAAARERPGTYVPLLWGIDEVHGHNNILGATLFPQNIALGATRNPDLVRRIGAATALEVAVTGQDWTFAPTLAVAQDARWGRTYESYAQNPALVAAYAREMVLGLQGEPGASNFLRAGHVIATAKHFIGDGGTREGVDQGDTPAEESLLRDLHGAGYVTALQAGVQTVMASFSSWQGSKLHGHHGLLTEVLKGRLGFDGFVIGDWDAHMQLPGCSKASCPAAILAGVDMLMSPEDWRALYRNTLAQVRSGEIPLTRLNDAVRRILRVKARAGLFEAPAPSARPYAGQFSLLGSPQHRALARQAVRESLVLLKNEGGLLPLDPGLTVLVAGDGADNIGKQAGGWSLFWQGGEGNAHFPGAQSIYGGIAAAVEAADGRAVLSPEGRYEQKPDAAIVVFGEAPYAELYGDLPDLSYSARSPQDLALLRRLKGEGIPLVAVFLSGRPLWTTPELEAADAFVAAWLPGSEGGGIADLLFRAGDGGPTHDFRGRLPFDWPRSPRPEEGEPPLFPYGYGLTYAGERDEDPFPGR